MLKRKKQQKYLIKRWLELRRQLYAFSSSGNQESLHRLRVEIKKIRAFNKFMKSYKGKKRTPKRLKTIRKIFHRAGIIREASINLQMIKQFDIHHPSFRVEAMNIIEQESGKFRLCLTRYDKHIRHAILNLLKALRPVRNSAIKHWFSLQLETVAKVMVAPSSDKLHLARKKIKTLIYAHGILHKRLVRILKINIAYLDKLQDTIGKWHDEAIAVELLISRNVGNKAMINRLEKERDKAVAAIHVISDDFRGKVFEM